MLALAKAASAARLALAGHWGSGGCRNPIGLPLTQEREGSEGSGWDSSKVLPAVAPQATRAVICKRRWALPLQGGWEVTECRGDFGAGASAHSPPHSQALTRGSTSLDTGFWGTQAAHLSSG